MNIHYVRTFTLLLHFSSIDIKQDHGGHNLLCLDEKTYDYEMISAVTDSHKQN